MDEALVGEGAPPLALRKFILAAGIGETGGIGGVNVYGARALTWHEFEEAWVCQQAIARFASQDGGAETRSRVSIRNTIALEEQGLLEQPSAPRPDWLPLGAS